MAKSAVRFLVLSVVLLIALLISGCGAVEKIEATWCKFAGDCEPPSIGIAVVADLTGSTIPFRGLYEKSIDEILNQIHHGDSIVMIKVTEASLSDAEIPAKLSTDKFVCSTSNSLICKAEKQKADRRLSAKKTDFSAAVKAELYPSDKDKRSAPSTDLMSSLSLAEKRLNQMERSRRILIILSDMVEETTLYNFEQMILTDAVIKNIIETEKKEKRLPDLDGVTVYVVGAAGVNSDKFRQLQKFWVQYIKAAGAEMETSDYSPNMLEFKRPK